MIMPYVHYLQPTLFFYIICILSCNIHASQKPVENVIQHYTHNNHDEYLFICAKCGKAFGTPKGLTIHSSRKHNKLDFVLFSVVPKPDPSTIVQSKPTTTKKPNDSRFKCDLCNTSFTREGWLNRHKNKHHQNPITPPITYSQKNVPLYLQSLMPSLVPTCDIEKDILSQKDLSDHLLLEWLDTL
ncbi:MAG TPA: C2H2-type zinc finger protein [Candidatus Babeliales bacterium]|nr:C2H2-type zinc finger protein [Candidatus Babeliales bacterium]